MVAVADCVTTPIPRLRLQNDGATSTAGVGLIGNEGEGALLSQTDPNSGYPAQVARFYWEGSNIGTHPDSVAVIRGMGNNRLSVESNGTITHIAHNGRYEFENEHATLPIQFTGYKSATADGRPFLFTNHNQTAYAPSVVQIGMDSAAQTGLQIGTWDGSTFTANFAVSGEGVVWGKSMTCTLAGESFPRFQMGMDSLNRPVVGMGSGSAPMDATLRRVGPNMISLGGVTASSPAFKASSARMQFRDATDMGFTNVQGKLTTDTDATPGTVTPTDYLVLYDASGAAYKVPCEAL